jgi:hypothetical protein
MVYCNSDVAPRGNHDDGCYVNHVKTTERWRRDGDLDSEMGGSGGLCGIAWTMTAGGWMVHGDSDVEA